MRNTLKLLLFLMLSFAGVDVFSQAISPKETGDSLRNSFGIKEKQRLGLRSLTNPFYPMPDNIKTDVEYDVVNKRYIVRQLIGDRVL
ncbi:MAG: hypothetical protein EOP48_33820, partial [Sphingobacteriales bacterium]